MVTAMFSCELLLIACSESLTSSPRGTHLMRSAAGESRHLWCQRRKPLHLAHAHGDLALSRGCSAPDPCLPVGRLAEASRYAPRTTFYPCQSRSRLGTQYCIRQRRKNNRSSAVPHLSKRWVGHPEPSRALHQRACDVSERSYSLSCRCLLRYSPALRRGPSLGTCHPRMPHRRVRAPLPRLAGRLERFQAGALRNRPTLHIPPEGNEQPTGQGHDANAPHATDTLRCIRLIVVPLL